MKSWLWVAAILLVVVGAVSVTARISTADPGGVLSGPARCADNGWQRAEVDAAGYRRELLWKGPAGTWPKGAILVMHGGGGQHYQWCGSDSGIAAPQVRFSELAVRQGFAVFLLNSSDQVSDNQGRVCGKVWDDEVRARPDLDLPFLGQVMRQMIPALRPAGSADAMYLTGLSSGGYMSVRAATHFNDVVTAFAPVSAGDPYGWHRECEPGTTLRVRVQGAGYDNETGKQIIERDSCRADNYPHEQAWDDGRAERKPAFRLFHHEMDGINDVSCADKVGRQLLAHGYPGEPDFLLRGGRRGLANHLWQDAYSQPILDFFAGHGTR